MDEYLRVLTINSTLTNLSSLSNPKSYHESRQIVLPSEVNWLTVLPLIKNQNPCGSCWAFSAAASLAGQVNILTGDLLDFSEQNILDCNYNNYGCAGGPLSVVNDMFSYLKKNGGILSSNDYPYTAIKVCLNIRIYI